ncbi:MAG: alpha-galactosidase [Bacteroidales bacterium]|nr:alpha-galactosidase [Bacteroidales bacterium]
MPRILFACILALAAIGCARDKSTVIDLPEQWKFMPGDDASRAQSGFDDSSWELLSVSANWDDQNYSELDGYAWYRLKFRLPGSIKRNAFLKDSLRIYLGKIDDFDEVYLNGELLGYNGVTVRQGTPPVANFAVEPSPWHKPRNYIIAASDPRIRWNRENLLAVRVFDRGGLGGIYSGLPSVSMIDIGDYLISDIMEQSFTLTDSSVSKTVLFTNVNKSERIKGWFSAYVYNSITGKELYKDEKRLDLGPGHFFLYEFIRRLPVESTHLYLVFQIDGSEKVKSFRDPIPYLLTPAPPEKPRINGPDVYGAGQGKPFLYRIPASGSKPMEFHASNLPEGLAVNYKTGIIAGKILKTGEYNVKLKAVNASGEDVKNFTILCGDKIALTPPMGWNSWNCWGLSVDQEKVLNAAESFVNTGLADFGWNYINVDDGWEIFGDSPQPKRDNLGNILTNEKFPDMRSLGNSIHALGLKFGIYSSPGPLTCGGYTASYGYELQDARTFASWGVDYLKYDWCSYGQIAKDRSIEELQKPYHVMRDALDAVNRDIVYSLCQYGMGNVWEWGHEVGGNLWRTTGDITDTWESLSSIGFAQDACSPFASPGHWNDPDMLVVGEVGWGPELRPARLTPDEQYTHISLWCLLSAPLLLGCNPDHLDPFTLNLLTNHETLAVNQDRLGKQARKISEENNIQVWVKDLSDGNKAVGIFNLSNSAVAYDLDFVKAGLPAEAKVRDLWRQTDKGSLSGKYRALLPPHGVDFLKLFSIQAETL